MPRIKRVLFSARWSGDLKFKDGVLIVSKQIKKQPETDEEFADRARIAASKRLRDAQTPFNLEAVEAAISMSDETHFGNLSKRITFIQITYFQLVRTLQETTKPF